MRKLVIFDLDNTLIDPRIWPVAWDHPFPNATVTVCGEAYHVYLRPKAKVVLQVCRGNPEISVAVYSAGTAEYVYTVLEKVVMPNLDPEFYFDAILSHENLGDNGMKMCWDLQGALHTERALLVDDSAYQCACATLQGVDSFQIKPFIAEWPESEKDCSLLEVLLHPFFYD
jgi:hypothetical protein